MIAEHSRWLSEALRSGRALPRIPLRKVSEGGFDRLRANEAGRNLARLWWMRALEKAR